jgi:hypothetical protein
MKASEVVIERKVSLEGGLLPAKVNNSAKTENPLNVLTRGGLLRKYMSIQAESEIFEVEDTN